MTKIVDVQRSLVEKKDVIDATLTVKVDAKLQTKSRVSGDLNTSIVSGKRSVRLPTLEIPTFSGDPIVASGISLVQVVVAMMIYPILTNFVICVAF